MTAASQAVLDASIARVQRAWEAGDLLHPLGGGATAVDLVRAVAHSVGAAFPPGHQTEDQADIASVIGEPEHVVFILIDGMGMNLVERMPETAFFRRHLTRELRSVYPSATACALTSIATGNWPCEHGITGWWTYLAERGVMTTALPFIERDTAVSLHDMGCTATTLFKGDPWLTRASHHVGLVLSKGIVNGAFSRFIAAGELRFSFETLPHCIERIVRRVQHATRPTYTYAYMADIDSVQHRYGPDDAHVDERVWQLDAAMEKLAAQLEGKARIVISADHGQIGVDPHNILGPKPGDPLLDFLRVQPSGDVRTPVFHVLPGCDDAFIECFHDTYGHAFALMPVDAVESLRLYGPGRLSPVMRGRLGDYHAVATDRAVFNYWSRSGAYIRDVRGFHSGMEPDEVRVPLIVA